MNEINTNGRTNSSYLLLFRGKDWDQGLSREQLEEVMGLFMAWSGELARNGKVKGGQALGREGKTVSGTNGRFVADGPFAESKEAIGGYLLVHADTYEEAVEIARGCPGLAFGGTIEVRPVLDECPCFKRARARLGLEDAPNHLERLAMAASV